MIERLLVFYSSSLDHRRIDPEHTPYLHGLLQDFPMTAIRNSFPEPDLIPTLFTGRFPEEHGIWQVQMKPGFDTMKSSLLDYAPDFLSTTFQCFIHLITGSYNLAGVPYRRRRRFDINKLRYVKREKKNYLTVNGHDTLLNIIGKSKCDYTFNPELDSLDEMASRIFQDGLVFELAQDYGLDRIQHWFLDKREKVLKSYNKIDGFIKYLHRECIDRGITLAILSDHGMERVTHSFDILNEIKSMGIDEREITYFIEATRARFWFHSEGARKKMINYLSGSPEGKLLSREDMFRYDIHFEDDLHGEYYFVLNPGGVFLPNDYYHPLANIYLGITEKEQRSRLASPVYRGYHGYMPDSECEKGFLLLLDKRYGASRDEINTIDFVPTVLDLLGNKKPESLRGIGAFNLISRGSSRAWSY